MTEPEAQSYQCENCEGTVRWKEVESEDFKYKRRLVTLERITIGVCDCCGSRYYSADTLHAVHATVVQAATADANATKT